MKPLTLALTLALCAACSPSRRAHQPAPRASSGSEPRPDRRDLDPAPVRPPPDPAQAPEPEPEPAPAATPVTARVSVEEVTVDDRPPPEFYASMVRDAVQAPLEQILECYEARLAEDASIAGDLRLRLWVSSRQVIRATPEDELTDAELQECAVSRIRTLTLPSSAPRAGASVRFLLHFATGPRAVAPAEGVVLTEVEATVQLRD